MRRILSTPRLCLREMALADLDFVAEMLAHPEVMRFYPRCYTRDQAREWIARQQARYRHHGHGLWLALDHRSREPVGQVGVITQEIDGREEATLAYLIHYPYWRCGFAAEAAGACVDYIFATLARPRAITLIRPENRPSQGVARKIGMRLVGRTQFAGFEHLVFAAAHPGEGVAVRPPPTSGG